MTLISIQDAAERLAELVHDLEPGAEIVLTENDTPIARLIAEARQPKARRKPGNCKGLLTIIADDDEHLEDFAEYMR
jgi:antitoxin (DNA-binding transcriptional repressor) of toxin-antitoxin stability system